MAIYEKKQARPAPINTKGATFWIRENLFPSLPSAILTILSFILLFYSTFAHKT